MNHLLFPTRLFLSATLETLHGQSTSPDSLQRGHLTARNMLHSSRSNLFSAISNTVGLVGFWLSSVVVADDCPPVTSFTPANSDYRHHCEAATGPAGSDPKWPCFSHNLPGDVGLIITNPSPILQGDQNFFLFKNGDFKGKLSLFAILAQLVSFVVLSLTACLEPSLI